MQRCQVPQEERFTRRLRYSGDTRKLYAFALVEAHSRMLYVEFTHSQSFESFVRCHIHAFTALGGVAREIAYDNLATAVAEHDGRLVRFLPRFLGFAREYGFFPHACNPASGWEKGKVERAIGYLRQNFWPLRTFTDLADVNAQARRWIQETANQRKHRETGQAPDERFQPEFLHPISLFAPDYRDTVEALVHKDLRLTFDGNRYCAPPRYVGHKLTVKADAATVTLYDQSKEIASYGRCWERGRVLGAERFRKELFAQLAAAQRSAAQQRLVALLGPTSECYLRNSPKRIAVWADRFGNCSNWFGITGRNRYRPHWRRPMRRRLSEPTISPTSSASSRRRATFSRRCA